MASSKLSYSSFIRRMNSLGRFGSKPGLARIRKLLLALGNPQNNYKCILVAGTNGKGSTTAFLASALKAGGYKTSSYFSPHLFSFGERIQVNGKNISKKDLLSSARPVLALLPSMKDDPPTFFEVATAMALLHFSKAKVKYAVLEVGLGGRLDATNAVEPVLSIITSIGLEHTDILGNTTAKIAREKAGILRAGVPVVSGVQEKSAKKEIQKIAARLHAPFYDVKKEIKFKLQASGAFQSKNAAIAFRAAQLLRVKPAAISRAISSTKIPGRWQKISSHPLTIIDCAHNLPAVEKIQADLSQDFSPRISSPRILLFAAMRDKHYSQMLRALAPHFDAAVFCRPPFARAEKLSALKKAAVGNFPSLAIHLIPAPARALAFSRRLGGKRGRVLVCGSIYLLAALFGEKEFKLTA